jgi:hypothetical protein
MTTWHLSMPRKTHVKEEETKTEATEVDYTPSKNPQQPRIIFAPFACVLPVLYCTSILIPASRSLISLIRHRSFVLSSILNREHTGTGN